MTTTHISDVLAWFARNSIRDDESYNTALHLLPLHEEYYFSTDEWEMMCGMLYNYEVSITGDFE